VAARVLAIAILALVGLAEFLCRAGFISEQTLPAPSAIAAALFDLVVSGRLNADIVETSGNIAVAAVIAILGGIALGAVIHAVPRLRQALAPFLTSYYAVPFFAFYPVFIVLFGIGRPPIIVMGVTFGIVAMIMSTLNGLDRVPRALKKTAKLYRLSPLATAIRITLPAAFPHLLSGMKLAVTYCFIAVIAAEFILSSSGLGYAIAYAFNNFDTLSMYAIMLIILAASIALNRALGAIEAATLRRWGW
jgi:NitT/TauT family transport system permease protein